MAGENSGYLRKCKQFFPYTREELICIPFGKIGTADSFEEKGVPGEQQVLGFAVQTYASRCVPRRVQDSQLGIKHSITLFEKQIGFRKRRKESLKQFFSAETQFLQTLAVGLLPAFAEIVLIIFMDSYGNLDSFLRVMLSQQTNGSDVVEVPMGTNNPVGPQIFEVETRDYLVHVSARIDHQTPFLSGLKNICICVH
jgi:hypothetical protein